MEMYWKTNINWTHWIYIGYSKDIERLFHGFDVAKTFGHVQIFFKWRGQISKSRGQNLAIGQDILGIEVWYIWFITEFQSLVLEIVKNLEFL